MRIDAHQHFWRPERGDYPWMSGAPDCLRRRFAPVDLAPLMAACGISASVLVQAAPTVEETEYLLGIADATPSVAGVVGWIDFAHTSERRTLQRLAAHPRLVGVRPMVQDIPDDDWVLRRDLDWAFAAVQELGLAFDALGYARHARRFLQRIERHPGLRVVIDHGMKPAIARGEFDSWAADIRDLARNTQALCKLSGLANEAAPGAGIDTLRPYMEHLLEVFGPARLIWGSDWPVASSAIGYVDWFRACEQLLLACGDGDRERVLGANAAAFYQIPFSD
jgi:L-fuconolactonase